MAEADILTGVIPDEATARRYAEQVMRESPGAHFRLNTTDNFGPAVNQDTLTRAMGGDTFAPQVPRTNQRRDALSAKSAALSAESVALAEREQELLTERGKALEPARQAIADKTLQAPAMGTKEERVPNFTRPTLDPAELNQSFMMMMAASMLVGAGSRAPFYTAMNAMTGALNGFVKQDAAVVKESLEIFDKNLTAIKERNAQKRREVEDLWKTYEHDLAGAQVRLKLLAAKYDDPLLALAARQKSITEQAKIADQNILAIERMEQRGREVESRIQMQLAQMEQTAELRRQGLAIAQQRADAAAPPPGAAATGATPDAATVNMIAERYAQGDARALTGLGLGRAAQGMRDAVLKRAAEITAERGMTGADVAGASAAFAADSSALRVYQNYVNRIEALGGKIDKDITTLFTVAEKGVGPTALPVLDKWIQSGRKALGDPDVSAFETQIQTVKNEYGRSMSGPASNAQLHVAAMQHADELINSAQNLPQLKAVVNIMRADIKNQRDVADEQIKAIRSRLSGRRASDAPLVPGISSPPTAPAPPPAASTDAEAKAKAAGVYKPGYRYRMNPDGSGRIQAEPIEATEKRSELPDSYWTATAAAGVPDSPRSTERGTAAQDPVLTATKQDQRALKSYASLYPSLKGQLDSPEKLMRIIDAVHAREYRNSPGTKPNYYEAGKAKAALADIYGINNYTPRGFMQWSDETKEWFDPRRGSGGDTERER